MGLFSKLFGKVVEDASESMFGDEKHYFDNLREDDAPQPVSQKSSPNPPPPKKGEQVWGTLPWGPLMPREENQYSFNGSYIEYFDKVFREEFPDYQITYAPVERRYHPATVFTFTRNGRTMLIVELISEKSNVKQLAHQCRNQGTPYLRFYYDHQGWWNTRSYVADRVRGALSV